MTRKTQIFFSKRVNRNDRKAMVEFLSEHQQHDDHFANSIKLYDLPLTAEQKAKLGPFMEMEEFYGVMQMILDGLCKDHGLDMEFGGKHGGYLELRSSDAFESEDPRYCALYADLAMQDLREEVSNVQRFDMVCDKFMRAVLDFIDRHEVVTERVCVEQTVIRERKVG